MKWPLRVAPMALLLSIGIPDASAAPPCSGFDSFAITGAQVFDGSQVVSGATVVVIDGVIASVGAGVTPPAGIPVIDGAGSTLMPGIIDAHAHARTRYELERAIQFGVTTELDMWTLPQFAAQMRREQNRTGAPDRADFFSAISPATVREGYPYNFTPEIEKPTIDSPWQAGSFVTARVLEGSSFLKIMIEDGSEVGLSLPVISRPTVRALTKAIHGYGKLAVAHVTEQAYGFNAVQDGVDGLVHIFLDTPVEPAFVQLAVQRGTFVVATLTAEESFVTTAGGASILADPELSPYLTEEEAMYLVMPSPPNAFTEENLQIARDNVDILHAAGVPILVGTDVPTHGISIHRELELLVQAGLDPVDALAAATSSAATAFGFTDRGQIEPGKRADLVLVEGDPTVDILATRAIRRIWKGGVELERELPSASPSP